MRKRLAIPLGVAVAAGLAASAALPERKALPIRPMAEIQAAIDRSEPGAIVEPAPGRYVGHLLVDKSITLDGHGQVILDAGGQGTVMVVRANRAQVMNLHLTNTGTNHDTEDSAVQVRGNDNVVRDNVIDDALFGIDLQQSYRNIIRRNRIASKDRELGLRGDAIRLWYSDDNVVERNVIRQSRDFVLWYSKRNRVSGNESSFGRYGLHLMFAADNLIEGNRLHDNSVGISMMYDQGDIVRDNVIGHSVGSTGTCLSLKEASAIVIENNEIQYCASGIALDLSPFQPGMVNIIRRNRISFDDVAISFLNDWHDNEFMENTFKGNMTEVAVYGGGSAKRNRWDGNSWDSYEGFDRDGDGLGDIPHRLMGYAGQVWMDVPNTRFFKGTPLLEAVDFLDRLAPFSEPELMLEDAHPRIRPMEEPR